VSTSTGFDDVVKKSWRDNRLLVVLLELTYDCNYDCVFCYNDRKLQGRKLDVDEYGALFHELADMGVLNLVLSGGEPLVHPHFFAIGALARARGFVVRVKSNGHLLDDATRARLVHEVDPFLLEVSLHGATPAVHDRQTRVPGSFAALVANLRANQRATGDRLRVRINSTLTKWNEHELDAMYALADELGLPLTVDPDVTPRDDGDQAPLVLAASDAGLRALAARHGASIHHEPCGDDVKESGEKHCGAGSSTLCIDPVGNVYPCVQWRRRVGNVRDGVLSLWRASPVLGEVRALTVDVKRMVDASGGSAIGFCPGTAESLGGSPLALYSMTARRQDALVQIKRR
jgi:MoaA/NifB/PqqE/SkfB family radical SAM enzyme